MVKFGFKLVKLKLINFQLNSKLLKQKLLIIIKFKISHYNKKILKFLMFQNYIVKITLKTIIRKFRLILYINKIRV